jgi:hypothetical protein
MECHHWDGNRLNNRRENLANLSPADHRQITRLDEAWKREPYRTGALYQTTRKVAERSRS